MIELPLVFLGGLLGSAHCVGMCGGLAVVVGSASPSVARNLARQLVYSAGRIFTYAVLGALVGYGGLRLSQNLGGLMNVQAYAALLAGVLLVIQGLLAAGVFRWLARVGQAWRGSPSHQLWPLHTAGCLMQGLVGSFLRDPRWSSAFLAGVFTGFLPCGLVYAYVALAAATSSMPTGMVTMIAFGLGTVPLMVLTGCGASLLSLTGRRRLVHAAAWCVVLTGALSIARGASVFAAASAERPPECPFCASEAP